MQESFQAWWESVNFKSGLSNLSFDNQLAVESLAEEAWEAARKISKIEIKNLQDNVELLEQTLEEEMSGDFEMALGV